MPHGRSRTLRTLSATVWRPFKTSVPCPNSTQITDRPAPETERTCRRPAVPPSTVSSGTVTSCSTSSGARPGASVMTVTVGCRPFSFGLSDLPRGGAVVPLSFSSLGHAVEVNASQQSSRERDQRFMTYFSGRNVRIGKAILDETHTGTSAACLMFYAAGESKDCDESVAFSASGRKKEPGLVLIQGSLKRLEGA